jgi:iron complex transport system permease protein
MSATTTATVRTSHALASHPVTLRTTWMVLAVVALAALCAVSVAVGVRAVSLGDIVAALSGRSDGLGAAAVTARLPRTVLAVLVGAALALAGTGMQAVTRNPLADPSILGVSGGAALAVVAGMAFFGLSGPYPMMAVAMAGAAGAAVLVYTIGSLGSGGATPLKLTLAGAAATAAFLSLVSAIQLPRVDIMEGFRFWQIGGVGGATWDRTAVVLPALAVGLVLTLLSARAMNSLALGDDLAAGLGVRVLRARVVAGSGAVILCGAATAVAGPIGFVGLVVPHVCRLLIGTDHRWLLPCSAVTGAALLVGADMIGRTVGNPSEIDVGIVTAVVGAPLFIWIVRRQKVREL